MTQNCNKIVNYKKQQSNRRPTEIKSLGHMSHANPLTQNKTNDWLNVIWKRVSEWNLYRAFHVIQVTETPP